MEDHPGLTAATALAVTAAVIVAVVLGGWAAGWWFTTQNAKRQGGLLNIQSHNVRKSYGFQQNLRDEVTADIRNVLSVTAQIQAPDVQGAEVISLKAQRAAILTQLCGEAAQVSGDPLDPQQAAFISANCEAGAANPDSQYSR